MKLVTQRHQSIEQLTFVRHEVVRIRLGIARNTDENPEAVPVQLAAGRMSFENMAGCELPCEAKRVDHEGHREGAAPPADRGVNATGWRRARSA